ncbi:MAG: 50S ribosomal protein L9 [Chloroflexi bacterium]|nr:50S ribosomal protein L9 [Chloroflexota bacterium]
MKVVFLEDVAGVAQGGDVKEVKNGFARNYLIPKNLAVPATHNALQQIKSIAQRSEEERVRTLTDVRALAEALEGTLINIEMRSGVNNRLYGSVTNAVVADELAKITEREIDRRTVILPEPIRELGLFEVTLRLHQEVEVSIDVLVYPIGADPEAALAVARGEEVTVEPSDEAAGEVASEDSVEDADTDETAVESDEEEADEEADTEGAEEESTEEDADEDAEAEAEDAEEESSEESADEPVAGTEDDADEEADVEEAAGESKETES